MECAPAHLLGVNVFIPASTKVVVGRALGDDPGLFRFLSGRQLDEITPQSGGCYEAAS
jgi:hypothetical protein